MNDIELKNQIKSLEREYLDLRNAMNSLSGNLNNTAILRGTLSGAGASAESILKCIIRREKINIKSNDPKIPAERADELRKKEVQSLMLDELIRLVESRIPLNVVTHLRTIQAWRNIGSHDKGDYGINETVNSGTLQVVSLALSELVLWFIGTYLNQDTSNFVYQEADNSEKVSISPIQIWTEEYWYAMRKGGLTALDEAKLSKIGKQHKIPSEDIAKIKSSYLRQIELFNEILKEAFEDEVIDIDELEAIEHSRHECNISSKETKSLLDQFNWTTKFKTDPQNISVTWMQDELSSNAAKANQSDVKYSLNINDKIADKEDEAAQCKDTSKEISLIIDPNWTVIQFRTLFSTFYNYIYFRIENNGVANSTKLSELLTDSSIKSFEINETMTISEFEESLSKLFNKKVEIFFEKNAINKNNKKVTEYKKFSKDQKVIKLSQANEYAKSEDANFLEYWFKPYHTLKN